MKKQRMWLACLVLCFLFLLIGGYVYGAYLMIKPDDDKICNGVYIDTVDISGKTREQAEQVMQEHIEKLSGRELSVDVNGKEVTTTLSALGYACDMKDYIDRAMTVGKEGNLFANYAKIKQVAKEHVVYSLEFTYSDKKLKKFVKTTCGKKCTNAKNSKIKMKNGKLTYSKAREGVTINVDTTIENIKQELKRQEDEDVVYAKAVVSVEEPKVTREQASRCKDKLGSFSTSFTASNLSRSKNVANAARLINTAVIYPGETFSVHDAISPMTEDNGYYAAPSYNNGQVVDSIGGGVCQVSTTLYNAVLRAELEIVERSPHSMAVAYVKPSMDAAIAGDYKDFKFRNNTDTPVYIEGGTYSGTIYFNVYGEETRSKGRKIEFISETTETIQPGADKVTYDKTKPASYTEVTQEAHTGYKAVLWKVVTEGGKSDKSQVNSSTYQASPRYIVKGAAKAAPAPTPTKKPEKGTKTEKTDKTNKTKPKATTAPKKTAVPTAKPTAAPEPAAQPEAE